MAREIKFRGKRIDNGEWVTGSLVIDPDLSQYSICGFDYYNGETGLERGPFHWTVDPDTVGQYTGLQDRKGKEIYAGDVLDGSWVNPISGERVIRLFEVVYEQGRYLAKLIGHHPYGTTMLYFVNERSEVIGNIYEHPHLLQEQGERADG